MSKVTVSIVAGLLVVSIALVVLDREQVFGVSQASTEADDPFQIYMEQELNDLARKSLESMRIEPIDPEWARGAEAELSAFLDQQAVLKMHGIPHIECHSVTCRLQLVAGDAEAISMEEWFSFLRTGIRDYRWQSSWSIIGFTAQSANGGTTVTWYFRRSGPIRDLDLQFAIELRE